MRQVILFSIVMNIVMCVLFVVACIVIIALLESFRRGDMCDSCCPYKVEPSNQEED